MTSGTINDSTKTYSWTLNLFWILVPLTIASGIWDLGIWSYLTHTSSMILTLIYGVITVIRIFDNRGASDIWTKKTLYSFGQGSIWGAAMIYAWPDSWTGPLYLIFVFINFCLLLMESHWSKKT